MCDHHNNYVLDSRLNEFGIRRRRECADCGERWSTMEIEIDNPEGFRDPWAEYRKAAVKQYLEQQIKAHA